MNYRQRKGGGNVYVRVEQYALRCEQGMNTCYTVGAGGVITANVNEGAEWQRLKRHRLPNMPRKRGAEKSVSWPLDVNSKVMQVRVSICRDRGILPDNCGRPRIGSDKYGD